MSPSDNLEDLKREEAELQLRLSEIRREKERVLQERRQQEAAEQKARELSKQVVVSILQYSAGKLQVQFEERQDLRQIINPVSAWTREKFVACAEWKELEEKILAQPNVEIKWEGDSAEKYQWHMNAPAWEVDVAITGEVILKAGPTEHNRYKIERDIPGVKWNYAKREYTVPQSECWRVPGALERTEDVVYTEAAQKLIFDEIERRRKLDEVAGQEDCSPEFLEILKQALDRIVWNPAKQCREPFWQMLRPFQRVNIEFAILGKGRLLNGDDTGLGKTIESIAYAELLRWKKEIKQVVATVKAANIPNWIREVENLAGVTPFVCYSGKPEGEAIVKIVLEKHPYIIISYDTLGSKQYTERERILAMKRGPNEPPQHHEDWNKGFYAWTSLFQSANPDLLILDEAHQIKNPDTHRFKAVRPLCYVPHVMPMTASPILNRTAELWTLLHMAAPIQFQHYDTFINRYTYDGRTPKDVEKLHELIRPMFLRRRKKDVLKDLPPINRINRYHTLSDRATGLYQKVLAGIYIALEHYDPRGIGGDQKSVMGILAQIGRLKQICAADKVEYTADLATDLADESDKKVLIFSQFKGSALAIAQRLGGEAICTVERKPDRFDSMSAPERDKLFEAARNDSSVKYIVTTEAAKEGHNLEFCDYVIFNDLFWTPEGHRQCEGRAYGRLSNPHPIDSYYIVADIDIEKWIMELLEKKMGIIEETIDQVENTRDVGGSIAMELISRVKDSMLRQAQRRMVL